MVLLVSMTPLLGSYLASGSPSSLSKVASTALPMVVKSGIAYPVAKIDVRALAPSHAIGVSAGSHPQALGVIIPASNVSALLNAISSSSSVSVLSGFDGLNQIQSCTCVPPDVQVAAGPNHIVEMVNLVGEIFSKQGVTNKTFALSSLFITGSDSISDPKVLFDSSSGRWFTSIVDASLNDVIVGVSSTSDPTGTWTLYALSAGGNLPDQPIIGVSNDKFVASANDFFSHSFAGSQYWVLNKSEMLTGSAASFATSGANGGFFSIHPVQSLSSTTAQYMVGNVVSRKALVTNSVQFFSITGVPGVSTVTTNTTVLSVSTLSVPLGGVQPGTSSTVNTGDFRVLSAVWFMGKLWYGLGDACVPIGDTQARSCIRLTMIDTTTSPVSIKQDFDFGLDGQYLFYPAVSMDGKGNLDLTYGYSSSTMFPSLAVTGQAATDPADSLAPPQTLKAGSAADTSTRYGDYFGAGLDPSTPTTVWLAGEYHSSSTSSCGSFGSCWSTFIGSITMANTIPVSVNNVASFLGIIVNTTGHLAVNTVNSTVSGSLNVAAMNSTTGVTIFNKTYTIPSLRLQNMTGVLQSSFLLSIGVSPYPLSSNIHVRESGGIGSVVIGVSRRVDTNGDGIVNIKDLAFVAGVFGSTLSSPGYDGRADIDGSGAINILDLTAVAIYFGTADFI